MKIKTQRAWTLETKADGSWDLIDIIEHHQGGDSTKPYVTIPIEAIDELVFQLLNFKRKVKNIESPL